MQKPAHLKAGDTVAVVSPSWGGPGAHPRRYLMGRRELETRFGLLVVEMTNTLREPEWVRTHPEARAEDLHQAFAAPDIKAVFASIGGEDSVRLIPYLDLDLIGSNPKIFMGFSDTTTLHMAAFKAGLQTFYGPAVMSGIAENGGMFGYTERWFHKTLMMPQPVGDLAPAPEWTEEFLDWADPDLDARKRTVIPNPGWQWLQGTGRAEGILLGGCMEVLEFLKATAWWPPLHAWRGAIFYWETSEVAPDPRMVEWWLRNYAAQGILDIIGAMLVGRPRNYSPRQHAEMKTRLTRFLAEEVGRPEMPVVLEMDFGHTDPMFILPNGGRAIVDADRRKVSLPEPAVL